MVDVTTPVEVLPKDWWKSKTHLIQVVSALASLGVTILGWRELSGDEIAAWVLIIQIIGNIATSTVRQYTTRPVTSMLPASDTSVVVDAVPVEPAVKEAARDTNKARRLT